MVKVGAAVTGWVEGDECLGLLFGVVSFALSADRLLADEVL